MMPILHSGKFSQDLVVQNQYRTDLQALDEKVKSMMEKGQKMIPDGGKQYRDGTPKQSTSSICKVCGKEGLWTQIRDHIEAHHLEGVSLPCNHCDKTFSARNSLGRHTRLYHKQTVSYVSIISSAWQRGLLEDEKFSLRTH